jgi:two-component system sensor histidine kinase KdpD
MREIEQIPELPAPREKHWQHYLIDSFIAVGGVAVVTVVIYAYHLYPTIPNISLVYLLLILLLATTRGRFAAVVAAVVAFLAFDFFLVPPLYTFVISRWEEWIALFVFLVTALITSQLTTQTRQSVEQARLREREARILYEAGRVINMTDSLDEQLDTIALAFVRVFSSWGVRECALLLPDKDGTLTIRADAPIRVESFMLSPKEMVVAREVFADGKIREMSSASSVSQSASTQSNSMLRLVPMKEENEVLGLLCLRIEHGVSWFASTQRMQDELEQPTDQALFFWTFLDQAVRVIEQAQLRARTVSNNDRDKRKGKGE